MPLTPEQKLRVLQLAGADPTKFDYDDVNKRIVRKSVEQPVVTETKPQDGTKFGFLGTAAAHAAADLPATGAGLAAGVKIGGATTAALLPTPLAPVAPVVGIGAGLLGGIGASIAARSLQDAVVEKVAPEVLNYLAESAQERPGAALTGNIAATLPFMRVDVKPLTQSLPRVLSNRNLANASAKDISNLLNVGVGAGTGVGGQAVVEYQRTPEEQAVLDRLATVASDPAALARIAASGAANALINDPRKWTQNRMGLTPNEYPLPTAREVGESARQGKRFEMPVVEAPAEKPISYRPEENVYREALAKAKNEQEAFDIAASDEGPMTTFQAMEGEGEAKKYIRDRADLLRAAKKFMPNLVQEVKVTPENPLGIEFKVGVDEPYIRGRLDELMLRGQPDIVDMTPTRLEAEATAKEQQARIAEAEARIAESRKRQEDFQKAKAEVALEEDIQRLPAEVEAARLTQLEEAPTVNIGKELNKAKQVKAVETELQKPLTEAEQIQEDYDMGRKFSEKSELEDPLRTSAISKALNKAKDIPAHLTTGWWNMMKRLAAARGVDVKADGTIVNPKTGKTVAGSVMPRVGLENAVADINPAKANYDTHSHEVFHVLLEDLKNSKSKTDRDFYSRMAATVEQSPEFAAWKASTKTSDINVDEFLSTRSGLDFVRRVFNLDKDSAVKGVWKDVLANIKDKWLKRATVDDYTRLMSSEILNRKPYAEEVGGFRGGTGEGERMFSEDSPLQQELALGDRPITDEQRSRLGESMRRAVGEGTSEVTPKQTTFQARGEETRLRNANRRYSEESPLGDPREFVTDFEKTLRSNERPFKLQIGKDGQINTTDLLGVFRRSNRAEVEMLKAAGLEEYLSARPRISKEELADWIKENGPQVKVESYGMEGKVSEVKREYDRMTHEWYDNLNTQEKYYADETKIYGHQEGGEQWAANNYKKEVGELPTKQVREQAQKYAELARKVKQEPDTSNSPRATSAYEGVSAFDTNEPMPEWTTSKERRNVQRVDVVLPGKRIWKGDIPEGDVHDYDNTLGWAMIQYKTGPNGEKIAVVVEAQSRWGQELRKEKSLSLERQKSRKEYEINTPDHPLLADYNRLILKAAIDQARKEGAEKIMISDAETAMMTEGHDRVRTYESDYEPEQLQSQYTKYGEEDNPIIVYQEPGMRLNYDKILPKIASELTGDEGTRISLGEHKNAFTIKNEQGETARFRTAEEAEAFARGRKTSPRENLIFKNPDGTPKTDVSGMLYDISVPAKRREAGEQFTMTGRRFSEESPLNNPNFKRWFEGSKVVDKNGEPLVVYHGSSEENLFNEFRKSGTKDYGYHGRGFYFSENADVATDYARQWNKEGYQTGGVYPVYLSLKKPATDKVMRELFPEWALYGKFITPGAEVKAVEKLKSLGYDGVHVKTGSLSAPEYVAFYPEQIKSATGNTGAFDPTNPDIRYSEESPLGTPLDAPDKPATIPIIVSRNEAILRDKDIPQEISTYIADKFNKRTYEAHSLTSEFETKLLETLDPHDKATVESWWQKAHARLHGETVDMTPEESAIDEAFRGPIKEILQIKNERGPKTKAGDLYREAREIEGYIPESLAEENIYWLTQRPASAEAREIKSKMVDWLEENYQGDRSIDDPRKQAEADVKSYVAALGSPNLSNVEFAALRRARGFGLPWELVEKDPVKALSRYAKRAAGDIAFFEVLQNDPKMRAAMGLYDQFGKLDNKGGEDFEGLSGHKAIKAALRSINKEYDPTDITIAGAQRAIGASIMQAMTGARDAASVFVNAAPYVRLKEFPNFIKALGQMSQVKRDAYLRGSVKRNLSEYELGANALPGQRVANAFNAYADFMRKYSGREFFENWTRFFTHALGREQALSWIADAQAGDKEAARLLKRFSGTLKDVDGIIAGDAEINDEVIGKIAAEFVRANQGGYDEAGLPSFAIEGAAAPFFALSRWSIEKSNTINKDVIQPLLQGNPAPFFRYTLAGLATGATLEKVWEEITHKRAEEPTMREAFTADEADIEDKAYKILAMLQLSSYAGIFSDIAKYAAGEATGQPVGYASPVSYPLYNWLTETLGSNISNAAEAIREGENPLEVALEAGLEISKETFQNARYLHNFANKEEQERKEKFRDVRAYKRLKGEIVPTTEIKPNKFLKAQEREFKRETDLEAAAEMLPDLLKRAVERSDDVYQLKRELRSLKQNNYQTMPSPENAPDEFLQYVKYLERTQGSEEAAKRLEDWIKQNAVNKAKSAMIPN